jgi:dihydroflavonol-4-reductase
MTRYVVTGATGFLGEHVVRALAEQGHEVVAIARAPSQLLSRIEGVEQVRADVTDDADQPRLEEALGGAAGLFHLAGRVSRDPADAHPMMRVHVDGTRKALEAAARAGVGRIVVASSSGTIAVSKDERVHTEEDGYATDVVAGWPYYASKIYQEKVARELAKAHGLEVVFVNPSLLLGPGDSRLSSTRDVLRLMRGQIPVVPQGGINFVDVRDAAAATLAAMERGRAGEPYLLGGPNWTVQEFFARLARAADVSPPRLRLPEKLSRWGAGLVEELYRARKRVPPIDKISVEMSQHYWWLDASKAERELGFEPREPALTLADTVKYLRRDLQAVG